MPVHSPPDSARTATAPEFIAVGIKSRASRFRPNTAKKTSPGMTSLLSSCIPLTRTSDVNLSIIEAGTNPATSSLKVISAALCSTGAPMWLFVTSARHHRLTDRHVIGWNIQKPHRTRRHSRENRCCDLSSIVLAALRLIDNHNDYYFGVARRNHPYE